MMRNIPLLRNILLFIAVFAFVSNILYGIRIYYHPESVSQTSLLVGYWTLPVAIVALYLYSYLKKKSGNAYSLGPGGSRVLFLLGHFSDTIRIDLIGTLGYVRFAAGGHTRTGSGRGELFGRGSVYLVRLAAAKLVSRYEDLVGVAIIPLVPVMTVVDNAMNVLVNL